MPGAQPPNFSYTYPNNKLSLATVLIAPKLSQVLDYTLLKKKTMRAFATTLLEILFIAAFQILG